MAKALNQPPGRMTVDEFLAWAMAQPEGRFELVDGKVVAMAPERVAHARLKSEVWLALRDAIRTGDRVSGIGEWRLAGESIGKHFELSRRLAARERLERHVVAGLRKR